MSEVTRYELDDWDKSLHPCGNGSWVTFDAYAAVVAEREALMEWRENHEASICPEDMGCEEYIAHLKAKHDTLARQVRAVAEWLSLDAYNRVQKGLTGSVSAYTRDRGKALAKTIATADSLPALGQALLDGGHVDA